MHSLGEFFFFFLCFLFILTNVLFAYTGCNLQLTWQGGRWKSVTTKTGPYNAERIVWALGVFFFLCFFWILTNIFLHIHVVNYKIIATRRRMERCDNDNGPIRRWTCCMGPRWVFYFLSSFFLIPTISLHIYVVNYKITTCLALHRPYVSVS